MYNPTTSCQIIPNIQHMFRNSIALIPSWLSIGGRGKMCSLLQYVHTLKYILTTIIQLSPRLRRGHNDQSHQGHQCSKTTLIIESQFHISIPLGIEPGSLMTGSKRVDHWTSGTVYECSEITGSPQRLHTIPHSLLLSNQQIFMNWDFSSSEYTT
jgi:hypothetical protein